MNSDDHSRAIIPLPDASLAIARSEGGRVLSELVGDTLALALEKPLRKIGEYEWCEPDYRQILLWAEALGLEPEEVIRRLLDRRTLHRPEMDRTVFQETAFENGRIVKLNWDLNLLPISTFEWVEGLEIDYLRLAFWHYDESARVPLTVSLPKLRELNCECAITELDLSGVPSLERLQCNSSQLSEIDLSKLPALTVLKCQSNQLTALDLSQLPLLRELCCGANELTSLALDRVPLLTVLECTQNQLIRLGLSSVPKLETLLCSNNYLREIDLTNLRELSHLECSNSGLREIDLSFTPILKYLLVSHNPIGRLDIRPLRNLESFEYSKPTELVRRPEQQNINCTCYE